MDRDPPSDTRGIIDPAAMLEVVDFARFPTGEALDGLVDWFWAVSWDLPGGASHDQQVLNHPAGNISVGTVDDTGVPLNPAQGRVYGVQRSVSLRRLTGKGWTVAARTSVGGLGVFLGGPARAAADHQLTFDVIPGLDGPDLVDQISNAGDRQAKIDLLRTTLSELVAGRNPNLVAEAKEIAAMVSQIEHDRSIRQVEQLAREVGVSVRSLQRRFDAHVGASPSFVIRRWRIIDAAEAARAAVDRGEQWSGWARVAAELGYADQAHLTRDFIDTLGLSPTAYVARNRRGASS